MIDTPITDAEFKLNGIIEDGIEYIRLDHARQLERELNATKRMLDDELDAIKRWQER